jgi:hypothetical protein
VVAARYERAGFVRAVYQVRKGPNGKAAYSVVIQFATPNAARNEVARLTREYTKEPNVTRVPVPGVPRATGLVYRGTSAEVLFADGPFAFDQSLTFGRSGAPDSDTLVRASKALYARVHGKEAPPAS